MADYANITATSESWTTETAAADDVWWCCNEGAFYLTTDSAPGATDGILLREGNAVKVTAGLAVKYRIDGHSAIIARSVL